ncbi:MAG: archaeosortase/exosortase family protein [Pseudanabaenaceae cyanobacterium bins.68]|nr:archaeosortase/exosortase family protein [Pseudanabaenaceae cyanobacterium bins.68]
MKQAKLTELLKHWHSSWWMLAAWSFPLLQVWQITDPTFKVSLSDLVVLAGFIYLWRPQVNLNQAWPIVAMSLAIALLLKSTTLFWFEPDLWATAWWLFNLCLVWLCWGNRRMPSYWRQLLLLNLFIAPIDPLAAWLINLRIPTAIAANFGLHYLGFEASRAGSLIFLPQGTVDVNQGCTALDLLIQTYRLVILLGMAVPISWQNWLKIHLVSVGIPFLVSVLRVMLLALIVRDRPAFHYWHTGGGGNWFALGSLLLTGIGWLKILGDQANFQFKPFNLPTLPRSRQICLSLVASLSLTLLIASWFNPQIGSRDVSSYSFPPALAHSQSSQPLANLAAEPPVQIPAAHTYQFPGNITLDLQYLVGTRGDLSDRYQSLIKPETKITTGQLNSSTSYQTWQQDQTQHFSTCLFSDRSSRVSPRTFHQEILQHPNLPFHFFQWLQGQIPLRDRRCVWVHTYSPNSDLQTLLTLWHKIYPQLVAQFPPL